MNLAGKFCVLMAVVAINGCASQFQKVPEGTKADGVQITQEDDNRLQVEIGGQLFTEYHFKDVPRPYCYPMLGPDEAPMTRNWPMKTPPGEGHDHQHHRSFWFAHGNVNGLDFWSEDKDWCKIVHEKFTEIKSGKDFGVIRSKNNWVDRKGQVVCRDERVMRIYNRPNTERLFDFEITLFAPVDKPVVFGDTKEGTMAMRLAETMRLTQADKKPGKGHIVSSTGLRDGNTWGKRADWVDYYGPVNDQIVGVAIFDHPSNPRHPTTWHVRDYGLFAANPFGLHDFEKAPKGAGNMTIAAGKSVTFRYRFYFHKGNETEARVADYYKEYINTK